MLYRSKYSLLRHSRAKCQSGLKHYSTVHISELTCLQVGEVKIDIFLGVDTLGVCIGIPMSSAWGFPWDFPWGNSCGNSTGREFLDLKVRRGSTDRSTFLLHCTHLGQHNDDIAKNLSFRNARPLTHAHNPHKVPRGSSFPGTLGTLVETSSSKLEAKVPRAPRQKSAHLVPNSHCSEIEDLRVWCIGIFPIHAKR